MQAKDIYPDRLNSMKLFVKQFINEFNNIRISLISFAGKPELQCIFTKDKDMFNFFLDRLNTQSSDVYGTNIGDALKKTYRLINDYMFKDSVIILLSDGEDFNDLTYDIINQNKNIPVFVIGFGTESGYNLKINDKIILTKLNMDHLKKIAVLSKGEYIKYTDYNSVRNWLNNNIEKYKTQVINKKYIVYEKQYYWFILISILFFGLWSITKI
jgi:Ca-activated chloride channel family protein